MPLRHAPWVVALLTSACAYGSTFERGSAPDAQPLDDDAAVPRGCDPACMRDAVCVGGHCVPVTVDDDADGVESARDCDDADSSMGAVAERACAGRCGAGLERCSEGTWSECDAPTECDCAATDAPRSIPCERCGEQRQVCAGGRWVNDGACASLACSAGETELGGECGRCGTRRRSCSTGCAWDEWLCTGEGVCMAGETETETEGCGSCGGTRTRTRACLGGCSWGAWGAWSDCSGASCCGDSVCGGGESCATCADCRAGHQGSGDNGDSCAGALEEQWRCVHSPLAGASVSQVCRSGQWLTYNTNPRNCAACVCTFSSACTQ